MTIIYTTDPLNNKPTKPLSNNTISEMSLDTIANILQSYCDVEPNKIWKTPEITKLIDQKQTK